MVYSSNSLKLHSPIYLVYNISDIALCGSFGLINHKLVFVLLLLWHRSLFIRKNLNYLISRISLFISNYSTQPNMTTLFLLNTGDTYRGYDPANNVHDSQLFTHLTLTTIASNNVLQQWHVKCPEKVFKKFSNNIVVWACHGDNIVQVVSPSYHKDPQGNKTVVLNNVSLSAARQCVSDQIIRVAQ